MAHIKPIFSLLILLSFHATTTHSLYFSRYKTAISLSHSLLTRVSNLRAARGDISGANRAKLIAHNLERGLGLGFWGLAWSAGWDYVKNYAFRSGDLDYNELYGAVSDLNQLVRLLGELTRADSEALREAWVSRNYDNALRVSKSVLRRFLKLFRQPGPLKKVLETVQKEVVEGGLVRDCLELGSNDLKGLVLIVKDFASQYASTSDNNSDL